MKKKIVLLSLLCVTLASSCSYAKIVPQFRPSTSTSNIFNNSILKDSSEFTIQRTPHLPNNGEGLREDEFYDAYSDYYADEYVLENFEKLSDEDKEEKELKDKLYKIYNTFEQNKTHTPNSYSGRYAGYNVINILSETLEARFAHPLLTPTLWKMMNNSMYFENYYVSEFQEGATCNTEFMSHSGLYPVVTNSWSGNMCQNEKSTNNIFKFALPAQLAANGYETYYFHLGFRNFYNRKTFIPNFGFDKNNIKFLEDIRDEVVSPGGRLKNVTDDNMIHFYEKFIDFSKPFYVSSLSYSMHGAYEETSLGVSLERKERVLSALGVDESYFDEIPQILYYLEKLTYYDDFLNDLLALLKEKNVLDKTIINIYRDHSPYMMDTRQYNTYIDRLYPEANIFDNKFDKDGNKIERTVLQKIFRYNQPLIIYNPSNPQREVIKAAGSSEDLAPTILNLLGFGIDKASYRYFMGYDMLSNSTCAFMSKQTLSDTNDLVLDSDLNIYEYYCEDTYSGDPTKLNYLKAYLDRCEAYIEIMKDIIDTNYFSYYHYEKGTDIINETENS